jgi:hypothetical protein
MSLMTFPDCHDRKKAFGFPSPFDRQRQKSAKVHFSAAAQKVLDLENDFPGF